MTVDIRDASLPEPVARMRTGEEVVIEDGAVSMARFVPPDDRQGARLGSLADLAGTVPDFAPVPDEDLDRWEREESERIFAATGHRYP